MISRRDLLKSSLVGAGLLVAGPRGVLAQPIVSADAYGTARASRLAPGRWLVHADLHNHTLFSDGDGDPAAAFASMRDAGLDVAALTDHTTLAAGLPESPCLPFSLVHPDLHGECMSLAGFHQGSWEEMGEITRGVQVPDEFLALRGFEWSSPTIGHMNVWFTREFTDPLNTGGIGTPDDILRFAAGEGLPAPNEVVALLGQLVEETPAAGLGMAGWYAWLQADPDTPVVRGGADGIFGFNHPGREAGRFSNFDFEAALVDRCVSLELFNRREDYLFERTDDLQMTSPLVACLDAGWRPGILGVTDEHGTDHGFPDGKGRAGLFVERLDEQGVREAMVARRFFATTLKGLRLFVTANGVPMGSTLGHRDGEVEVVIDVDRGAAWTGRQLGVQVLATGSLLPALVHEETIRVPAPDEPLPTLRFAHDVADGRWLVVRLTDPESDPDGRADEQYRSFGGAVAYASPIFLDPDLPPPAPVPTPTLDPTDLPSPTDSPSPSPSAMPSSPPSPSPIGMPSPSPSPAVPVSPPPGLLPTTGGGGWSLAASAAAIVLGGALGLRRRHPHDHD